MEGTIEGLPALAVSCADYKWRDFEASARIALDVAEQSRREDWDKGMLLNLNVRPCRWSPSGNCAGAERPFAATPTNSSSALTPAAAPTSGWPVRSPMTSRPKSPVPRSGPSMWPMWPQEVSR